MFHNKYGNSFGKKTTIVIANKYNININEYIFILSFSLSFRLYKTVKIIASIIAIIIIIKYINKKVGLSVKYTLSSRFLIMGINISPSPAPPCENRKTSPKPLRLNPIPNPTKKNINAA